MDIDITHVMTYPTLRFAFCGQSQTKWWDSLRVGWCYNTKGLSDDAYFFQGLLVYVNYGTINDFLYLTENLSLSLSGRICIARYGHNYRGDKVCHFLMHGYCFSGFSVASYIKDEGPMLLTWVQKTFDDVSTVIIRVKRGGRRLCTSRCRWHPRRSASTKMEGLKSLVAGLRRWGGREGGANLSNLWLPMMCILSSANNSVCSHFFTFTLITTEAFTFDNGSIQS